MYTTHEYAVAIPFYPCYYAVPVPLYFAQPIDSNGCDHSRFPKNEMYEQVQQIANQIIKFKWVANARTVLRENLTKFVLPNHQNILFNILIDYRYKIDCDVWNLEQIRILDDYDSEYAGNDKNYLKNCGSTLKSFFQVPFSTWQAIIENLYSHTFHKEAMQAIHGMNDVEVGLVLGGMVKRNYLIDCGYWRTDDVKAFGRNYETTIGMLKLIPQKGQCNSLVASLWIKYKEFYYNSPDNRAKIMAYLLTKIDINNWSILKHTLLYNNARMFEISNFYAIINFRRIKNLLKSNLDLLTSGRKHWVQKSVECHTRDSRANLFGFMGDVIQYLQHNNKDDPSLIKLLNSLTLSFAKEPLLSYSTFLYALTDTFFILDSEKDVDKLYNHLLQELKKVDADLDLIYGIVHKLGAYSNILSTFLKQHKLTIQREVVDALRVHLSFYLL